MNTTVTIPAELEAAFTAAHAAYLDAAGNRRDDYPTWCRRVAAARRAMAQVCADAQQTLPEAGLLWHALFEAETSLRRRAHNLDTVADRHEQEGRTAR